jgi:hypothetical protein
LKSLNCVNKSHPFIKLFLRFNPQNFSPKFITVETYHLLLGVSIGQFGLIEKKKTNENNKEVRKHESKAQCNRRKTRHPNINRYSCRFSWRSSNYFLGRDNVFVSATAAANLRTGQDFFPLTVDYKEKFTAAGKFPGGYFKREGRPSEKEI